MKATLTAGISHQKRYLVPQGKVVAELYPESVPMQAMPRVFATGFLVGLVEWTCIELVNRHLDWPLEQTVGTAVDLTHEAPTPPGLEVTVTVSLVEVDGRRLVFEVEASDGVDTITRGRHERTIIDRERFAAKAERKRQQLTYAGARAHASTGGALADDVRVLAVDIFGTTVDWWTGIAGRVEAIAGQRGVTVDAGALASGWRDQYLPSMARVNNRQRDWVYLYTLHRESLDELLAARGLADTVDEPARDELVRGWHRLPAWPDAAEALDRLRSRYTVVAFSNGGFALLTELAKHNGLRFDAILSAENARAYKPAPAAYQTLTRLLDLDPSQVMMVACHGWDLDGARAAGLRTAFVERPAEKGPDRTADRAADVDADVSVADLSRLADRLGC